MALMNGAAIATRLREVLSEGAGSLRAIASTRFGGDYPEGLGDGEAQRRTLLDAKPLRIRLVGPLPHPNRITVTGSVQIEHVDALITVVRGSFPSDQLDDDLREAIEGAIVTDGSAIEQAVEWPPNLATTIAGTSTGIKGGRYLGLVGNPVVRGPAGGAQHVEATYRVRLTVVTNPATS